MAKRKKQKPVPREEFAFQVSQRREDRLSKRAHMARLADQKPVPIKKATRWGAPKVFSAPAMPKIFAEPKLPAPVADLPVPTPRDRVPALDVPHSWRPGAQEFRAAVLQAYGGRCCISGCGIDGALDAAHIIPFVDERSNLVSNGLCLRADLHRLYDRNLLKVGADGVVWLADDLARDYGQFYGESITLPVNCMWRPNRELLAVRHKFIVGPE